MRKTLSLFLLLCSLSLTLAAVLYAEQIPIKGYVTPEIGLNVRTGPSEGAAKIGALEQGTSLTIVAVSGGWYKITSPMSGYVHGGYVAVTEYGEAPEDGGEEYGADGSSSVPTIDYSSLTPEERAKYGRNLKVSASNAKLKQTNNNNNK